MRNSRPSDTTPDVLLRLIVSSYRRLTGGELIAGVQADTDALRAALWEAPCAIVAHGTQDDPIFFYANRMALRLFGMSFDEFIRMPSRFSAEPLAQEARVRLLEEVARQGYVSGYSGMRIGKSGRRFMIADATVWNLFDEHGAYHGQAAVFVEPAGLVRTYPCPA